jgi:hypothetical protein
LNSRDTPGSERSDVHLDYLESSGSDDYPAVSSDTGREEEEREQHDAVTFHACTKRQRRRFLRR